LPEDIVARAIDAEMKRTGEDCRLISTVRSKGPGIHPEALPTESTRRALLVRHRLTNGADPGGPAAHYQCADVRRTFTGDGHPSGSSPSGSARHGAPPRREPSRLELPDRGAVFSHSASASREAYIENRDPDRIPKWNRARAQEPTRVRRLHNWEGNPPDDVELRTDRSASNNGCRARSTGSRLLKREISEYYWNFKVTGDLLELRNICTVAELIVLWPVQRKESGGSTRRCTTRTWTMSTGARNAGRRTRF